MTDFDFSCFFTSLVYMVLISITVGRSTRSLIIATAIILGFTIRHYPGFDANDLNGWLIVGFSIDTNYSRLIQAIQHFLSGER